MPNKDPEARRRYQREWKQRKQRGEETRLTPDMSPIEKLLTKCRIADECWEWTGACNEKGYGRLVIAGIDIKVHRLAYVTWNGPIPSGIDVLHHCDNPPCFCPEHLFLGTDIENIADKVMKGRQARVRGEKNGRTNLREEDIRAIRNASGSTLEIALLYRISPSSVSRIRLRQRWDHIEDVGPDGTAPA